MKVGRNEPCPCGSGKKYKQCCLGKESEMPASQKLVMALIAALFLIGLVSVILTLSGDYEPSASSTPREGLVWSEEHQHWH